MDDLEDLEQIFVKQERCGHCDLPLNGENWGCAHAWVPVHGLPVTVELHQHLHIRCAEGFVKWLAMSTLGRARVGLN